MAYAKTYLSEVIDITKQIDPEKIENIVDIILNIKKNKGRIFFLGVGGSAGNSSHAVNDFRKIIGIESYTPTDNVSELTARTNDDGWDSVLSILQMPGGVPVATVALDGAKNAGILAAQIVANFDKNVSKALTEYKESLKEKVIKGAEEIKK